MAVINPLYRSYKSKEINNMGYIGITVLKVGISAANYKEVVCL